jgi:hypothetical protein
VSTSEPAGADQLTGVDFCPTCQSVVTWERHIDDATGRVVHDSCSTALAPPEPGNVAHARALSSHESAHQHQILDAHGKPPTIAGHPGRFQLTAELPISCAHCDATSEDLVAALDDSEHDTAVVDGRVYVWPVIPVLPTHLASTVDPS